MRLRKQMVATTKFVPRHSSFVPLYEAESRAFEQLIRKEGTRDSHFLFSLFRCLASSRRQTIRRDTQRTYGAL